jgi:hypothetical protein
MTERVHPVPKSRPNAFQQRPRFITTPISPIMTVVGTVYGLDDVVGQ